MEFEFCIPEKVMEIRKICLGHEKVMEMVEMVVSLCQASKHLASGAFHSFLSLIPLVSFEEMELD